MFVVDEFLFVLDRTFISFFRKPLNEQFLKITNINQRTVNATNSISKNT